MGWLLCRIAVLAGLCASMAGCAPRSLVERAIRARGGPIRSIVTHTEAEVYLGVPGVWQMTRAFLVPNLMVWTIVTAADPIQQVFDGTAVRLYVGSAEVSVDASPGAPLRSEAQWTAALNLDALRAPDVTVTVLARAQLPAEAREGVLATFPDGARYRLGFDEALRLVWAQGPVDLSPFGAGELTARFTEHRRVGDRRVPFAVTYWLDERRLAREHVLVACIDLPGVTPAAFADPSTLPECR